VPSAVVWQFWVAECNGVVHIKAKLLWVSYINFHRLTAVGRLAYPVSGANTWSSSLFHVCAGILGLLSVTVLKHFSSGVHFLTSSDTKHWSGYNKYECSMDQELADAATYAPSRRYVCTPRSQRFSAWNDIMTAMLNVLRHMENHTPSIDACIYVKNSPNKFHPDQIGNDGALGFLTRSPPTRRRTRTARGVAIWNQFLIQQSIKS